MESKRPHRIVSTEKLVPLNYPLKETTDKTDAADTIDSLTLARDFVLLSEDEAGKLEGYSENQRADWYVRNVSTKERLARYLESKGIPRHIVDDARRGVFDDYDDNGHDLASLELVKRLKALTVPRYDVCKVIRSGAFDATIAESDAWAARQTGEDKAILEEMADRTKPSALRDLAEQFIDAASTPEAEKMADDIVRDPREN